MSRDKKDSNIVVVALIYRDGKIFVARRATHKKAFPNKFELIGGHVRKDEKLEHALVREVKEEIKIDIQPKRIIDAFTYWSEDTFKVEICYLSEMLDPSQEPILDPEDHSESRWINPGEYQQLDPLDEETLIIENAFKEL